MKLIHLVFLVLLIGATFAHKGGKHGGGGHGKKHGHGKHKGKGGHETPATPSIPATPAPAATPAAAPAAIPAKVRSPRSEVAAVETTKAQLDLMPQTAQMKCLLSIDLKEGLKTGRRLHSPKKGDRPNQDDKGHNAGENKREDGNKGHNGEKKSDEHSNGQGHDNNGKKDGDHGKKDGDHGKDKREKKEDKKAEKMHGKKEDKKEIKTPKSKIAAPRAEFSDKKRPEAPAVDFKQVVGSTMLYFPFLSKAVQDKIKKCGLNLNPALQRCELDNGKGNCQLTDIGAQKKCSAGTKQYGCCLCAVECPDTVNYEDNGYYCTKKSFPKSPMYQSKEECENLQKTTCESWVGAFWVPKCKAGFRRVGADQCVLMCPSGWTDSGRICFKPGTSPLGTPYNWQIADN